MSKETPPVHRADPWHPFLLAAGAISVAARLLPAGAIRDRYHREFIAELYGMSDPAQVKHAGQLLLTALPLRTALVKAGQPLAMDTSSAPQVPRAPLACRLHLYHKWRTHFTEDGQPYKGCAKCGKDSPGGGNGPLDYLGGADG